ncbi:MAG: DUF1543 domain-containing protein [Bacteroidota bacterium]
MPDNFEIKAAKLYMVLLGSKAPGRNVEQHDYFFGIGASLKALLPEMQAFWPEAKASLHIDAWREVSAVDGYTILITARDRPASLANSPKLFFINLGGYLHGHFEEQHHIHLTVQNDRVSAIQQAKRTAFYKTNSIKGGLSHIDDKYGIDVDDVYRIDDLLNADQKEKYAISILPGSRLPEDEIHLGYLKLDKLMI